MFQRNGGGDMGSPDEPSPGCQLVVDEFLLACVNQNQHQTTCNLFGVVGASNATGTRHLKNLGIQNLIPMFDTHDLAEAQAQKQNLKSDSCQNPKGDRFGSNVLTAYNLVLFYIIELSSNIS